MTLNSVIPSVPLATPEDIQAITESARDYIEGWFAADAERMNRAVLPELVKRSIWHDLQENRWKAGPTLTAEAMVHYTQNGGESTLSDIEKSYEIVVLDVFRHSATVKVSSYPFMDYLHLAKIDGRWQIMNCLFELRQGEHTEP
jgi:hypothetical protein